MTRHIAFLILALPLLAPHGVQAQTDVVQQIDTLVRQYHEARLFNGGVLVARSGDVIYEQGFGNADRVFDIPNTPETKFLIGSVTKNFTAALILQLVEEGCVDLQAPITTYLPQYSAVVDDRVTVHHLLTHTSGIPSYTSLPEFRTEIAKNPQEPEALIERVKDRELNFEPGTQWTYSNSGYVLLGMIVEAIVGEPYDVALRERLLEPAGMAAAGYFDNRTIVDGLANGYRRTPTGYVHADAWNMTAAYAAGAMYATPRDLYRWDRALRERRVFQDGTTYDLFYGPHVEDYGYGWSTKEVTVGDNGSTVRVVEHGGGLEGFVTGFRRFPEEEHLIVVADNTASNEVQALVGGITRILYGQEPTTPKTPIADVVARLIADEDFGAAAAAYHILREEQPEAYDFSERQLNRLGYMYLWRGHVQTALDVFRLNVESFPNAFNTYDSLGEALAAAGDTAQAVANYRRSLELNPGNASAEEKLRQFGAETVQTDDVSLSAEQLERYVGLYRLQPGFEIEVTQEGTRLYAEATGYPRFELFPQREAKFYVKDVPAQVEFHDYDDGTADSLTLFRDGSQQEAERVDG